MIPERLAALRQEMEKGTLQFILCQPLIFMNRSMLENILKQEDLLPDLPVRPEQQWLHGLRPDCGQTEDILCRRQNS